MGDSFFEMFLCFLMFFEYPTQDVATELIPPRYLMINPSDSVSQFRLLYGTFPVAHRFCAANVSYTSLLPGVSGWVSPSGWSPGALSVRAVGCGGGRLVDPAIYLPTSVV